MTLRVQADLLAGLRRAADLIDRDYAAELTLADLAAVAGLSKYHFLRCFSATYGITPLARLSRRRIERAQDLLRATNLTVTEVCLAVGYQSLGSFSARFREIVGRSPTEYQAEFAAGAPHIPGCFLFMTGIARQRGPAIGEKQDPGPSQ